MPTSSTPQWAAQHAGVLGQADAIAGAASVNQLLGTHPGNQIYQGSQILTPSGTGGAVSGLPLNVYDKAQPFTMSGTSIGRVQVPFFAVGQGADLIVSLCNNNSGVPGTVITRTRIPASWFLWLAKYAAISASPLLLAATGSPIATAASNTLTMGGVVAFPWSSATPSGGGTGTVGPAVVSDGIGTIVLLGGLNGANNYVTDVATITYAGAQQLDAPVPQPAMPAGLGSYAAVGITVDPSSGAEYVIAAGGQTGNSGSYTTVASVYAATLDPNTSAISSWSTQTSLPVALQTATGATSGNTFYVVGGVTASNTIVNTVYWAAVTNGQLQTWNTGPTLPVPLYSAHVLACNGFLFVIGGYTAVGLTAPTAAVWYAPINSDGSLGAWLPGPAMPFANTRGPSAAFDAVAGTDGLVLRGYDTQGFFSLPVLPTGPGTAWQRESFTGYSPAALIGNGPGQYWWFEGITSGSTTYTSAGFIQCPYLSVPLPATGLTNGATYHIMFQQPAGAADLNNYLSNVFDSSPFPGNPLQMTRPRGSTGAWTTANSAIPFTVYDNSNASPAANGATGNTVVLHTWEDSGARIGTLVRTTTPDQRLIGLLEATASPTALNSNSGFQSAVSPWTGVNATIAQSSAQSYEGGHSLLLTPNGGSSSAYAASEFILCTPGVSYTVTGWCMSPGGYANTFANLDYYNSSFTLQAASSSNFNAPAGVWTPFTTTFAAPTAACVNVQIHVGEQSTPGAGNLIYFDQVMIFETFGGPQASTVAEVEYAGTWPGAGSWPPTGVAQLA